MQPVLQRQDRKEALPRLNSPLPALVNGLQGDERREGTSGALPARGDQRFQLPQGAGARVPVRAAGEPQRLLVNLRLLCNLQSVLVILLGKPRLNAGDGLGDEGCHAGMMPDFVPVVNRQFRFVRIRLLWNSLPE